MTIDDARLEAAIRAVAQRFRYALTGAQIRTASQELARLVAQRSPEQIARMERARGLR